MPTTLSAGKIQGSAQDASGNALSVAQFSYDAKGRPSCVATRMNPSVFNALPGNACTQSGGAADRITQTDYDLDDRVLQTIQGVGTSQQVTVKTYQYTANGKVLSVADGNSNKTGYVYDGFDRLKTVNWPTRTAAGSAATLSKQYAYDNFGRKVSETASGQTISFAYDGLGRLTSESEPVGTVSYSYSLANMTRTIAWPDGAVATYSANQAGQPRSVQMAGSEVAHYSYDASGRLAWITYGGTQAGAPSAVGTQYGYDGISRLSSLSLNLPGTPSADQQLGFSRNPAGQITTRTLSNGAYRYPDGVTQSAVYSANTLNQIVSAGGGALSYDGAGNLSATGGASYAYDQENHLTGVSGTASLSYDPEGRLIGMTKGATRQFLYAGSQMIGEYDGTGALVSRYVPDANGVTALAQFTGSGAGTPRYLLTDQQGSVIAEADGAGNALTINTYDGYGMPGSGNDTAQRYQYTGQMWLWEAGLYHYKARAYSPSLRRFLQTDPKGYDAGMNVYAYVNGDPINATDPSGMIVSLDKGAITFIIGCFQCDDGGGTSDAGMDCESPDSCTVHASYWNGPAFYQGGGQPTSGGGTGLGAGGGEPDKKNDCPSDSSNNSTFNGDATYYNLPGSSTAYGGTFNPNSDNAAMYRPGQIHNGDVVVVQRSDASGSVTVTINDTGPFARGPDGSALHPLQPDPQTVIDLTPHAFTELTGSLKLGRVPVTVTNCGSKK